MLTSEVKQRINTCRDILVGKLPDPKSQVIQITNALIYKFMDDQDRQAEKLGGKASFFTDTLKPYAWHKLFDSKLTNQERADLYVEGIEKLSNAKNLPELFRDIFKEAYVPFKAAGTITLFIEEINKFDYLHSEELGNAYEYLLSIMGSQGDAGQFRTPRHIIEFMVDLVDPQKNETIYDPACGTAGFLIAAYTHILEENGGNLTATERNTLAKNINGIDISPDMAKMARVNLYLHGFNSPVIDEGDTLSDENLWGTKYDVILANPPFMSPKGGIIPHNKFAISANKAEVLFTDYIAEHLKLKGRAAIVVPDGIIFSSNQNYTALRKMLVEDGYLHSVISLPAGVFQPYAVVKTSILVLDRERARESSEVLFIKIENDGYTLSSQRSEREGSQLPEALSVFRAWQKGKKTESLIASCVAKSDIAKEGDYNLTGGRYRIIEEIKTAYPVVQLGELVTVKNGLWKGKKPPFVNAKVLRNTNFVKKTGYLSLEDVAEIEVEARHFQDRALMNGDIILENSGGSPTQPVGRVAYFGIEGTGFSYSNFTARLRVIDPKIILPRFLWYQLNHLYNLGVTEALQSHTSGIKNLDKKRYLELKIPLPPINIQQAIVDEITAYEDDIVNFNKQVEERKLLIKSKIADVWGE